jgi:hypothetical protein
MQKTVFKIRMHFTFLLKATKIELNSKYFYCQKLQKLFAFIFKLPADDSPLESGDLGGDHMFKDRCIERY